MTAYSNSIEIINRGLQLVGARRITTLTDLTKNATEAAFLIDKMRRAELRRNVWRFATRKTILRPLTATSTTFQPLAWAIGTTYGVASVVASGGQLWISPQASNVGNLPGVDSTHWLLYTGGLSADAHSLSVTYQIGDLAVTSSQVFFSLTNGNLNHATSDTANWAPQGAATAVSAAILEPLGLSTNSLTTARSIFRLPANFMRMTFQDPKAANNPVLNTSGGIQFLDWAFEGNYFTSATSTLPVIFRFGGDTCYAPDFDDLFGEALGCRIGYELCEALTGNKEKKDACKERYGVTIAEARLVNSIEVGSTEPLEEDFIGPRTVDESGPGQPQQRGQ